MSEVDRPALQRAWPMIVQLISLLQVHLARFLPNAADQMRLLHLTRLAESLVRRWLVLEACQSSWPRVRLADKTRPHKATRPRGRSGLIHFALLESERPMPVMIYYPATDTQPAIYMLQRSGASGAQIAPISSRQSGFANLPQRCDRLQAVVTDPAPHIRRMARWLARATKRRETGPGRPHPLRVGWPPGASRRQKRRDPDRYNMLMWLDRLAREAVDRGGP